MSSIKEMDLFGLNCFVKNITCKLSTITDFHPKREILCVVSEWNDLLLHFTNDENVDVLKIIRWFRKASKTVINICFDPTGVWLLVMCSDNTIHIVPALYIVDSTFKETNSYYSTKLITSFVIPQISHTKCFCQKSEENENNYHTCFNKADSEKKNMFVNQTSQKLNSEESFLVNSFPVSSTWWKTSDNINRAVIGYSDGTIIVIELTLNCPLLYVTSVGNSPVVKLSIYKTNLFQNVFLLITSLNKQYKLLLEQKSIDYVFPGDSANVTNESMGQQFQPTVTSVTQQIETIKKEYNQECDENSFKSGLLPTAKARLSSLKMLGTKKINAMKIKQSKQNSNDFEDDSIMKNLTNVKSPDQIPELLSDENGPIFAIQSLQNVILLSALHTQSSTLSVYGMNTAVLPLFKYKVPKTCCEILITSNILYSKQFSCLTDSLSSDIVEPENYENNENNENNKTKPNENVFETSIAILSSALASIKSLNEKSENQNALLSIFHFYNEIVINVHRKAKFLLVKNKLTTKTEIELNPPKKQQQYFFYNTVKNEKVEDFTEENFPSINFDPCYVVTNKNIYFIDLRMEPLQFILDFASAGLWKQCEQFCNIFDISFSQCLEYVGDYFLRKKKVNQALLSYNVVKTPPVRTALKLAMHRENYPLMHLCAMALRNIYVIKSKFINNIVKSLFPSIPNLHAENLFKIFQKRIDSNKIILNGEHCSDFKYGGDESPNPLQMTLSSQFHLSNLLLITLAEKAVRDKNYIPLWNYLVLNGKYHTNMTSIVLSQSGLHSSALILAKTRGSLIEVFIALTSVLNQEFGFYSELNVCLYNLTDKIFSECLIYLKNVSIDYLNTIQNKLHLIKTTVLKRLEQQLNPFSAIFRPLFFSNSLENTEDMSEILKFIIETYLAVLIHLKKKNLQQNNILNAFNNFKLTYEEKKFAIPNSIYSSISVGYSHCCCVIDGIAYFWGSNGAPVVLNVDNLSETNEPSCTVKRLDIFINMNLEVFAVKCGRQHTLILTNNGLFSFGSNQLCQLGVGKYLQAAQHPMLIQTLDCKNITLLEAGQYHNAVYADNKLYTWGWGLHGQLGHGDIENVSKPKILEFFNDKHVKSVSLGHAHTLVLCDENSSTKLYVFGSNHFGQLGLGQQSAVKISIPQLLDFDETIILIQTKFFCNLVLTDKNELYTWGSSPQALRVANQSKRRTSARKKIAESIKKEISRREENINILNSKDERQDSSISLQHNSAIKISSCDSNLDENNIKDIKEKNVHETGNSSKSYSTLPLDIETCDSIELSENNENKISENIDHTCPQKIDTQDVIGRISYISSGLFHYALVTSQNLLYTWGKNYELQLGNEDRERKQILSPKVVENIAGAQIVECGANFTLVMNKQNTVQSFGSNSNGQCGQSFKLPPENSLNQNRLLCLPTTKRLIRHETHCVMYPHEIDLPSPKDISKFIEPYFKSVPKYQSDYLHKIDSNLIFGDNKSLVILKSDENNSHVGSVSSSSEESSEKLSSLSSTKNEVSCTNTTENDMNDYIHYCLFIFHGLYNPEKIINFSDEFTEFKIRILMLNYNYLEAFSICLLDCNTAQKSTKVFEYFTKDTSIVPIKKDNIKFFISRLLNHFLLKNFNMIDCETFFLSDLNYYVTDLSFVIYFNSDNSKWAEILNRRLENFLNIENEKYFFDKIDEIFDKLSVSFKAIVSKRIIKLLQG